MLHDLTRPDLDRDMAVRSLHTDDVLQILRFDRPQITDGHAARRSMRELNLDVTMAVLDPIGRDERQKSAGVMKRSGRNVVHFLEASLEKRE